MAMTGYALKQLRRRRKLSATEVSRLLGVSVWTLRRAEKQRKVPQWVEVSIMGLDALGKLEPIPVPYGRDTFDPEFWTIPRRSEEMKTVGEHESVERNTNDLAIRLREVDETIAWLNRQAGVMGLAANAVQRELRVERDAIVELLKERHLATFEQR